MVPHETVEGAILAALTTEEQAERIVAIMGVADPGKGEALVLLSTLDVDLSSLRAALANAGVPNLWIPRTVRRVDAIPVLASGKLDLAGCKALAEQV
jgi:acyl-[acyl-carrier-protein]-phospholipid O-acyltransferase/long-chain-fatty-acid--[acyl-carrier-protein] ligase